MSTAQTSTVLGRLMAQMSGLTEADLTPPTDEFNEDRHEIVGVLSDDQRRLWVLGNRVTADCNADHAAMTQLAQEIRAAQNSGVDDIDSLRKLAQGALSIDLVERYAALDAGLKPKRLEHRLLRAIMDAEVQANFPDLPAGKKMVVLSDWSVATIKKEVCPGCGGDHRVFDLGSWLAGLGSSEETTFHH